MPVGRYGSFPAVTGKDGGALEVNRGDITSLKNDEGGIYSDAMKCPNLNDWLIFGLTFSLLTLKRYK